MVKLSDTDLQNWQEETKDVKELKKDSAENSVEFSLDFKHNEQLIQDSEIVFHKQMMPGNKYNDNDFKSMHALSSDGSIHSSRKTLDKNSQSKLKSGKYPIQARIDLHGLTASQAHGDLIYFIQTSKQRGLKCVLVVHGKGKNQESQMGIIKKQVPHWLESLSDVLSFTSAKPQDGGTGSLYVLLRTK